MGKAFSDIATDTSDITVYLVLIVSSILVTRYWINLRREEKKIAKSGGRPLPGPWGIPIFGNMLSLDQSAPHLQLMKLSKVYGNVFKIQLGSRSVLVLNGLRTIQDALVKQSVVFAGRPDLHTFTVINKTNAYGPSVGFTQYSEEWKRHRRLTETSLRHFTSGSQVPFLEGVAKCEAEELVRHILIPIGNRNVDIQCLIRLSVSNTMLSFMFRKRSSYNDETYISFIQSFDRFMKALGSGNPVDFLPWLKFIPIMSTTGFEEVQVKFNKGIRGLLDEKHELYDPECAKHIMDEVITTAKVDEEMEFQRLGLAGREVLQNAYDFFAAGFETASTTLEWALVYMVMYPQAQSDVQKEIDTVVGRDRLPTWDDRVNLPLTQSCLLEIQRFASVGPFTIPHSTTKDTLLNGYYIPQDIVVFVNLYSAHFDTDVWELPKIFNHCRFLSEDGSLNDDKKKLLVPFSIGRRQCVGADLARFNLFIYFTTLLHQLRFSSPEDEEVNLDFVFGVTLRPKKLNVRIEAR